MFKSEGGSWNKIQQITNTSNGTGSMTPVRGMSISPDGKELHYLRYVRYNESYNSSKVFGISTRDDTTKNFKSVDNNNSPDGVGYFDAKPIIPRDLADPDHANNNGYLVSGDNKLLYIGMGNELRVYKRIPVENNKVPWEYLETIASGSGWFAKSWDVSLTGRTIVVSDGNYNLKIYRKE